MLPTQPEKGPSKKNVTPKPGERDADPPNGSVPRWHWGAKGDDTLFGFLIGRKKTWPLAVYQERAIPRKKPHPLCAFKEIGEKLSIQSENEKTVQPADDTVDVYVFTAFPLALGTAVRKRRLACPVQLALGRLNVATALDKRLTLGLGHLFEKTMRGADVMCKAHNDDDVRYRGVVRSDDAQHPPIDSIATHHRSPDSGWTPFACSDDQAIPTKSKFILA